MGDEAPQSISAEAATAQVTAPGTGLSADTALGVPPAARPHDDASLNGHVPNTAPAATDPPAE
jgi:hypothetical protein